MLKIDLGIPLSEQVRQSIFDRLRAYRPEFAEVDDDQIIRRTGKDTLLATLADIRQIPFLKKISHLVDKSLIDKLGPDLLQKAKALPLVSDPSRKQILIAIADPQNNILEDELLQNGKFLYVDKVLVPTIAITSVLEKSITMEGPSHEQIMDMEITEIGKEVNVFNLGEKHEDPVVALLAKIIVEGITQGASDIHIRCDIEPELYYHYRIDGDLRAKILLPVQIRDRIDSALVTQLGINPEERVRKVGISGRLQVAYMEREVSIRYERTRSYRGYHITMRILDKSGFEPKLGVDTMVFPLETLKWIYKVLEIPYGIIVMSGPTGSGKSTTLNAMLREINRPEITILTLENPVEDEINGVIHHEMREASDFPEYMKSFMRADPNKMFVGEVRDRETAHASVEAALTGHQVLTTTHVNTAAQVIERFEQLDVPKYKLASTLKACMAQRLIKTLCTSCKERAKGIDPKLIDLYSLDKIKDIMGVPVNWETDTFFVPKEGGCSDCNHSGYKGRRPILEMIPVDEQMQELMMKPETTYLTVQYEARKRFKLASLKDEGLRMVVEGATTLRAVADGVELTF